MCFYLFACLKFLGSTALLSERAIVYTFQSDECVSCVTVSQSEAWRMARERESILAVTHFCCMALDFLVCIWISALITAIYGECFRFVWNVHIFFIVGKISQILLVVLRAYQTSHLWKGPGRISFSHSLTLTQTHTHSMSTTRKQFILKWKISVDNFPYL